MFRKVLVANRGEIALRIFRTLREMEIPSVSVYSNDDSDSLPLLYADYRYPLDGNGAKDTYMNIDKIIKIALAAEVDAIHPGYGFLSENEEFAKAVENAGLTFIGPKSEVIATMGNKYAARKIAEKLNVPLVPGVNRAVETVEEAEEIANKIGYPVLIKPAAGGGGKGMKIAMDQSELNKAFEQSQRLAESVFHDKSVFIEKYFPDAHHIEVQIIGDMFGNVIHLGERECSIQRRFQKVVEESPCLLLNNELRKKIFDYAKAIASEVNYHGAGTVEFLYSNGEVYFLEMNTRIQVEHAVTEMVTGIDIVKLQIMVAAGLPLPFAQEDIIFKGHAIECRIYSEDPFNNFLPSVGTITTYQVPDGIGVRVDSGVHLGYNVDYHFDPMMAKLIVIGDSRKEAIMRMRRALDEFTIEGPATNIEYLKSIMSNKLFVEGKINTKFLENEHEKLLDVISKKGFWSNKLKDKEMLQWMEKESRIPTVIYVNE